jgi:hypothetical protein
MPAPYIASLEFDMAFPTRDPQLVPYTINFAGLLNSEYATFQVTQAQAQVYNTASNTYVAAVEQRQQAIEQGMRSKPATRTRDQARKALLSVGRNLYDFIQSSPNISDADKERIGVHVRDVSPQPARVPTQRPKVDVVAVNGWTLTATIRGEQGRGRKPAEAISAFLYTFVGEEYPSEPSLWAFHGAVTRSPYELTLANTVPAGSRVWLCAAWVNRRGETGPISVPISVNIQGGGVSGNTGKLKIAA